MSSDLWSAFVANSKDLSDNPWAQHTTDDEGQPNEDRRITTSVRHPHTPSKGQGAIISAEVPWGGSWSVPIPTSVVRRVDETSNESWAFDEPHGASIWEDTSSARPEHDLWSTPQASQSREAAFAFLNKPSPKQVMLDDDEFGDFEDPELVDSKHRSQTEKTPLASAMSVHDTGLIPEKNVTNTGKIQLAKEMSNAIKKNVDDFSGLVIASPAYKALPVELASQTTSTTDQKLSTWVFGPNTMGQITEVPYQDEEWGEFSPDPATNTHFEKDKDKEKQKFSTNNIEQGFQAESQLPLRSVAQSITDVGPEKVQRSQPRRSTIPAPTNVPPPSILISLVSGLVQMLPSQVETAVEQSPAPKTTPEALQIALRSCIASLRVAARVLSGRKLRWKRDSHLSQSMRIGPAQAGKPGGMKLVGVDKSEVQREDREAAELVRTWKQNLGSIRAALALVNSRVEGQPLVLPDISANVTIRIAKATEGGITAPKCCFLCGLKRDERVTNVDIDIWDTLGEWWTEHWGHKECKKFWEHHEKFLQGRG